ncbi:MAG: hypothetical protein M1444_00705 [Patescibacteria group bacterium]|nr:hypothetical protein [Patescibacteria group bacterium]
MTVERRVSPQRNDCANEGLSTCRRIKDSGLHGEAFPVKPSQVHTEEGRRIRVRPELIIRELRV